MKVTKSYIKSLIRESLEEIRLTLKAKEGATIIKTAERLENNLLAVSAGHYEEEDLEDTLVTPIAFDSWKKENKENFDWRNTGIRLYQFNDGLEYYRFKDIVRGLGF